MDISTIPMESNSRCLILFFIVLVTLTQSCTEGNPTEDANQSIVESMSNSHVIILLDKTLSLTNDSLLLKFEQPLRSRLVDLINLKGDEVTVYYIHGNTGGAQAVYQGEIKEAKPSKGELEKLGGASRKERQKKYEQEIDRQRFQISGGVKTALTVLNPEKTKLQTDLWATLETISRAFANTTAADKKYVFYVSDMEESMKGENRRDFTKKAPIDKSEAEVWAKEDLGLIQRSYKVEPEVLAGTQVSIYLPKKAQEDSNFQTVLYYWEAIFDALNIPNPEVRGIEIGL